ncbi:hypothetical protein [Streptomyces sp. S1]|uniref:hypothetical protein n=1 Tax=Streptomyces sp. S1 TaxID=718288 RepID=UPI003D725DEA
MARTRTALVVATALALGIVPATTAAAASPAPAPAPTAAATAAETGTAVQEGGPLVVPVGEDGPVTTRFTVTLPASVTGRVTAGLLLPMPGPSAGNDNLPLADCSVNGGPYERCGWQYASAEQPDSHDDGYTLSLTPTQAARTLTYDVRISSDLHAVLGRRAGILEMKDAGGNVVATGPVVLHFVRGTPTAWQRTTVHARDKKGVLWQYEGTGRADRPFKTPTRVGGGWGAYTALTKLDSTTATGWGSLVARDKAGVLWYYEGSGDPAAPFKPRVRVGGGWNAYTSISAGKHGLIARDRDGVLWNYPDAGYGSTARFKPRVRVGGGWNAYDLISTIGERVVARDKKGVLWSYEPRKHAPGVERAPYKPRVRVGGGWNAYDVVRGTGDVDGWSRSDGIARDRAGHLWLYKESPHAARVRIGWGWNVYDTIV